MGRLGRRRPVEETLGAIIDTDLSSEEEKKAKKAIKTCERREERKIQCLTFPVVAFTGN